MEDINQTINDESLQDNQQQLTMINQKYPFESHLELMNHLLTPSDQIEFNSLYSVEKPKYEKNEKVFTILAVGFALFSVFIIPGLFDQGNEFLISILSFIILFVVLLRLTMLRNFPFTNPLSYTWYKFLIQRGIEDVKHSNLYKYVKSYIKKTSPNTSHYLSYLYTSEELETIEVSSNSIILDVRKRIKDPLSWDWSMVDKPSIKKYLPLQSISFKFILTFYSLFTFSMLLLSISVLIGVVGADSDTIYGILFLTSSLIIGLLVSIQTILELSFVLIDPNIISEMLNDLEIKFSKGKLYVTLQNYLEENFPYIEV